MSYLFPRATAVLMSIAFLCSDARGRQPDEQATSDHDAGDSRAEKASKPPEAGVEAGAEKVAGAGTAPDAGKETRADAAGLSKTFKSDLAGFSIEYPSEARIETHGWSSTRFQFTESFEREGVEIHDDLAFAVRVHKNAEHRSARAWADSRLVKDKDRVRARSELEVGGVAGYRFALSETDEVVQNVTFVTTERAYELSYVDPASPSLALPERLKNKYEEIFRKMLASFHCEQPGSHASPSEPEAPGNH